MIYFIIRQKELQWEPNVPLHVPLQILNFLDVSVIFNSKNGISTDVYYKDVNTHDYLPYDSAHLEFCKKNGHYN